MTATPLDSLSPHERSPAWRRRFTGREWVRRSLVVVPSIPQMIVATVIAFVLGYA